MAGCFPDFRGRASSFDLHNLQASQKMSILNKLFRSKSDTGLKMGRRSPNNSPSDSPRNSPRGSPGAPPRRRFARVIRDNESKGEEYVNPHVIRKYNKGYGDDLFIRKSASLDDESNKPYAVPETTILKKHRSMEGDTSPSGKHTCFNEDVEVVEYDTKEKCAAIMNEACIMHQPLQDDVEGLQPDQPQGDTSKEEEEEVYSIVASLDLSLGVIDELRNGETSLESSPVTELPRLTSTDSDCSLLTDSDETSSVFTDTEPDKRPLPERQSSSESEDEGRSAPKKPKSNKGDKVVDVPESNKVAMALQVES